MTMQKSPVRIRRLATPQRQSGVALAISLVLLVAMTILGVATLSSTRLNERITSNAQQKSLAFEVAESAINSVWTVNDMMTSIDAIPTSSYNNPAAISDAALDSALSQDYDQNSSRSGGGKSVDLDATVTVQYCGESALPEGTTLSADESEIQMTGLLFDVNGVATITNSSTRADHLQRGAIIKPKTGRTGACVTP